MNRAHIDRKENRGYTKKEEKISEQSKYIKLDPHLPKQRKNGFILFNERLFVSS